MAYERWREAGEQQILDEIEDHNCIDCISTEELRDWLANIRPAGAWPQPGADASQKEGEEDADAQALRAALSASGLPEDRQAMLFNLGLFHKREAKPAQWAVFDSASKDEDDLIDDLDALTRLETMARWNRQAVLRPQPPLSAAGDQVPGRQEGDGAGLRRAARHGLHATRPGERAGGALAISKHLPRADL